MAVETFDVERQEVQSPATAGQQYIDSLKVGEAVDDGLTSELDGIAKASFGVAEGDLVGVQVGNMSVKPESE
jgi:hypothetical protein